MVLISLCGKTGFLHRFRFHLLFNKVINTDKNIFNNFATSMGKMEGIAEKFSSLEAVRRISSFLDGDFSSLCIKGLYGSSKGIVLSSAISGASSSRIHLVISDTKEGAEYIFRLPLPPLQR